MNLGSPSSTATKDVRSYLQEFLMDEFVIDYPVVFRWLLVNGIIAPFRAPKSAAAYKTVWTKDGSPLIVETEKLKEAIQLETRFPVYTMMRYGQPSPQKVFDEITMHHPSVEEVIIVPLYPHWTMSSYETAVVYARKVFEKNNYAFQLKFIPPFYKEHLYLNALAASIKPHLNNKEYDAIMFSYHGVPQRHMVKDEARRASNKASKDFPYPNINYQEQCIVTTQEVAKLLNIPSDKAITTFQSRLTSAGAQWILPYTAPTLEELPSKGVKKLLVVCPAFINDCLETLEEIAVEGKHIFEEAGGESFTYIPCINQHPDFVQAILKWTI